MLYLLLALAPVLVVILIAMRARRQRLANAQQVPAGASIAEARRATGDEILAYFQNAQALKYQPISETVARIGLWDASDDWDWGRFVYEWRRPKLRMMVMTQSGSIRKIELLDPLDTSRFGTTQQCLLDEPFDIERQ